VNDFPITPRRVLDALDARRREIVK
jgi:hypothetical protein